jgi:hypothetical protein
VCSKETCQLAVSVDPWTCKYWQGSHFTLKMEKVVMISEMSAIHLHGAVS